MRIILLGIIICLFALSSPSYSQDISPQKNGEQLNAVIEPVGKIEVYQDSWVDTILNRHIQYNHQQNGIDGYRVQIFFDAGNNSLNRASNVAEQFQLLFPGDTAYISFSEPYYKVRVGDFRTKLDAEGYLQEILPDYPNAFVIKDKINFPRLD
jgi:hypothetical protein